LIIANHLIDHLTGYNAGFKKGYLDGLKRATQEYRENPRELRRNM